MTRKNKSPPAQSSMFAAFEQAAFEQKTAHLPATIEAAIPHYRGIIERFHAAILAGHPEQAKTIRQEADDLACRLNGGTSAGIKGGPDAVCYVLERATAAPAGVVPLWGQTGEFTIDVRGCAVRVEFEGLYGLCMPQFAVHAVHWDKPFISDTGYRNFMGHSFDATKGGITVDKYVQAALEAYIDGKEMKGRLKPIEKTYRDRHMEP